MNAARPSRRPPTELAPPAADLGALRARRRQARRRRTLARVDVGLGVGGAIVLLIASPGLAITGLIAALVLAVCAASVLRQRRAHLRARRRVTRPPASRGDLRASTRRRA